MQLLAVLAAVLAATVSASPMTSRAQMCDVAPSGSTTHNPIAQPSVATAEDCRQQCNASSNKCESFCFGLRTGESSPRCILFDVSAANVPPQAQELHVFDKACSGVPMGAPTHEEPRGKKSSESAHRQSKALAATVSASPMTSRAQMCDVAPSGSTTHNPIAQPSVATAEDCRQQCNASSNKCESFCFGLRTGESSPRCILFDVSAADVPPQAQELHVFDKTCSDVPMGAPTHEEPRGKKSSESAHRQPKASQQKSRPSH